MKPTSKPIWRLLWVFIGSVVCGLGIKLILLSGAGADPLTMFEEGLSKTIGVDTGIVVWGFNMIMLVIAFFLNRKAIGWGSLVASFFIGPAVTFFGMFGIPAPATFPGSIAMNVLGVVVCGLGIAIYMTPAYGVGAMEAIMMFISDRVHKTYGLVRVCMDCTWGVIGFFLGGTLGIGTIIGAFGIGTSLDLFFRGIKRFVLKEAPASQDA